jgi:hypothetical protein
MRQFLTLSLLTPLLIGCAAQTAQKKPLAAPKYRVEDVRKTRVYVGEDGLRVDVADLADNKALIKVTGSEGPAEGLVREHELVAEGRERRYRTKYEGRVWNTLYFLRRLTGELTITLYAPGRMHGQKLTLDEKKKVDVAALLELYSEQAASGKLDELARFDPDKEHKKHEEALAKEVDRVKAACGFAPEFTVQWQSFDQETMMKKSVSGYCSNLLSAMRDLCRHDAAKKRFARFKTIRCRRADKQAFEAKPDGIVYSVDFKTPNLTALARKDLGKLEVGKTTLDRAISMGQTDVCKAKGKEKYVIVAPHSAEHPGVAYGDGKRFFYNKHNRWISENWFFDPRQWNPGYNSSFRGVDLRSYSRVNPDHKKNKCTLTCGKREIALELLDGDAKGKVLEAASYVPGPHQREAYAMARNRKGVYYYVDRGTTPETRKDFRVYVGRRGRMKRQQMKDIVSDSEGDIFSTKRGKLRLVLGKEQALWIGGRRSTKLLWVPVRSNLKMIYNELGVYLGVRLGVPCDDL